MRNSQTTGDMLPNDVERLRQFVAKREPKYLQTFPSTIMIQVRLFWGETAYWYPCGVLAVYFGNNKWWLSFSMSGHQLSAIFINGEENSLT